MLLLASVRTTAIDSDGIWLSSFGSLMWIVYEQGLVLLGVEGT